ncbi:transposase [uncultured Tissierella sp.]|uniref:transposase n=1 Tax=uncultured Tissierella sp. TaxID=448160 RepID=UPI00280427A8|nr:transposase [uncultured Tissierella sp.]MDU5082981.1 transposase [Bacillota bacterium]
MVCSSDEIIKFLKDLLDINRYKRVFMIWDNARIHTSKAVEEFINQHEDALFILNLPPYSPMLNPQENIWKKFISDYFNHANSNKTETKSLVNARSYYK